MEEDEQQSRSSPHESSATTNITTPEVMSGDDDDVWASDDNHDNAHESAGTNSGEALLSDLPTIKRQHMTDGYREGLSIGKAKVMQTGFDAGYPIGVAIAMRAGKVLGYIEGILEAKDIPDESKEAVAKVLKRAKDELAVTALLKGMNDQQITGFDTVPASIDDVLSKWENMISDKVMGESKEQPQVVQHDPER